MKLFFRLWISATAVVAFLAIFFVGLATLQFNQIHVGLVAERLAVIADNAAAPFEAAARIGLPLSSVRTTEALLEKARQSDARISAVHLYAGDGTVLQSTDTSLPQRVASDVWAARLGTGAPRWYHEGGEWISAGQDILNISGEPVGGVIVAYSSQQTQTRVWAMAAELFTYSLAIILFATLLIGAILRLGLKRAIASFDETEHDLAGFDSALRRAPSGTTPNDTTDPPHSLGAMLQAARQSYLTTAKRLDQATPKGDA